MSQETGTYYIVIGASPIADDELERANPLFDTHR